jgi:hypothetical protein
MKLDSFYRFIAPEVRGCPTVTIDVAVIDAIRDFCQRTDAWRTTATLPLIAGMSGYEVDIPTKTDVVRILRVEAAGESIQNLGAHMHHNPFSSNWVNTHKTYTFSNTTDDPNTVYLTSAPAARVTNGLIIEASLKPQHNNTNVDDALFDRWYEPIVMKAKHILFLQPGTAWNNPELSAYYFQLYNRSTALAQAEARKEYAFKDASNPEIAPIW